MNNVNDKDYLDSLVLQISKEKNINNKESIVSRFFSIEKRKSNSVENAYDGDRQVILIACPFSAVDELEEEINSINYKYGNIINRFHSDENKVYYSIGTNDIESLRFLTTDNPFIDIYIYKNILEEADVYGKYVELVNTWNYIDEEQEKIDEALEQGQNELAEESKQEKEELVEENASKEEMTHTNNTAIYQANIKNSQNSSGNVTNDEIYKHEYVDMSHGQDMTAASNGTVQFDYDAAYHNNGIVQSEYDSVYHSDSLLSSDVTYANRLDPIKPNIDEYVEQTINSRISEIVRLDGEEYVGNNIVSDIAYNMSIASGLKGTDIPENNIGFNYGSVLPQNRVTDYFDSVTPDYGFFDNGTYVQQYNNIRPSKAEDSVLPDLTSNIGQKVDGYINAIDNLKTNGYADVVYNQNPERTSSSGVEKNYYNGRGAEYERNDRGAEYERNGRGAEYERNDRGTEYERSTNGGVNPFGALAMQAWEKTKNQVINDYSLNTGVMGQQLSIGRAGQDVIKQVGAIARDMSRNVQSDYSSIQIGNQSKIDESIKQKYKETDPELEKLRIEKTRAGILLNECKIHHEEAKATLKYINRDEYERERKESVSILAKTEAKHRENKDKLDSYKNQYIANRNDIERYQHKLEAVKKSGNANANLIKDLEKNLDKSYREGKRLESGIKNSFKSYRKSENQIAEVKSRIHKAEDVLRNYDKAAYDERRYATQIKRLESLNDKIGANYDARLNNLMKDKRVATKGAYSDFNTTDKIARRNIEALNSLKHNDYKQISNNKLKAELTANGTFNKKRFEFVQGEANKLSQLKPEDRIKKLSEIEMSKKFSDKEKIYLKEQVACRDAREKQALDKIEKGKHVAKATVRVIVLTPAKYAMRALAANSGDAGAELSKIVAGINKARNKGQLLAKVGREYRRLNANKREKIAEKIKKGTASAKEKKNFERHEKISGFADKHGLTKASRARKRQNLKEESVRWAINKKDSLAKKKELRLSKSQKGREKLAKKARRNSRRAESKAKFKKAVIKTKDNAKKVVSTVTGYKYAKKLANKLRIPVFYNKIKSAVNVVSQFWERLKLKLLLIALKYVALFVMFCVALDIILGALTTGWGAIIEFFEDIYSYEMQVENVFTDTPFGYTAQTLLSMEDTYYHTPQVYKNVYQTADAISSKVSWIPIIGNLVDYLCDNAKESVSGGFERNVDYYYYPVFADDTGSSYARGMAADVSYENILLVTTPNKEMTAAESIDTNSYNYAVINNTNLTNAGIACIYAAQDKSLSGTEPGQLRSYEFYQDRYGAYYPYYLLNIGDALITQEGSAVMYYNEYALQTGRVSNIKQILSMTSVVFEVADDETLSEGQIVEDEAVDGEKNDLWSIIQGACQVIGDAVEKLGKIAVDGVEDLLGVDLPEAIIEGDLRAITEKEVKYATAAYWASHDVYMTYAATPTSDMALDSCGRIINQHNGTNYKPVCEYLYFQVGFSQEDSAGNELTQKTVPNNYSGINLTLEGPINDTSGQGVICDYGHLSSIEIDTTDANMYGAYDSASITLQTKLFDEFVRAHEGVESSKDAIMEYMNQGSCYHYSEIPNQEYDGYYGIGRIPVRIDGDILYVGNGNYEVTRTPLAQSSISLYPDVDSSDANITRTSSSGGNFTAIFMGNIVEEATTGKYEHECKSFIEFAICEGIKSTGNDDPDGVMFGMCVGHPRVVFALQTYTFGLEGTYIDDGELETERVFSSYPNGSAVQTLFDRVDADEVCERIEREFAYTGIAYQGWSDMYSEDTTMVDMSEQMDQVLASHAIGELVTWPAESDDTSIGSNRERARALSDKNWEMEYNFNISGSAFFNKALLNVNQRNYITMQLFKTYARPGIDVDANGNSVPIYQPIVSAERYKVVYQALQSVGNISYLRDCDAEPFLLSDCKGVRLNSSGDYAYPYALDSSSFVVWVFASQGIPVVSSATDTSWDAIISSPYISEADGINLCPGDIVYYTKDNEIRGGIFLYYADEASSEGYIIEEVIQGHDDNVTGFDVNGNNLSDELLDALTQEVGCVSLSRISTGSCHRLRPSGYNGETFVVGSATTSASGNLDGDGTENSASETTDKIIQNTSSHNDDGLLNGQFHLWEQENNEDN